jgi:hypothetical protein
MRGDDNLSAAQQVLLEQLMNAAVPVPLAFWAFTGDKVIAHGQTLKQLAHALGTLADVRQHLATRLTLLTELCDLLVDTVTFLPKQLEWSAGDLREVLQVELADIAGYDELVRQTKETVKTAFVLQRFLQAVVESIAEVTGGNAEE